MKRSHVIFSLVILGLAAFLSALLVSCGSSPTGPSGQTTIRLNAGGPKFTDSLGQKWSADKYFDGGVTGTNLVAIAGTTDDDLYQTERGAVAAAPLTYTLPVNNGNYQVTLKFAEIFWNSPGQRVWDVLINGVTVLDNYDAVAAVGVNTADDRSFDNITPISGNITVALLSVTDNAKISAIQVIPMSKVPTATATQTSTATLTLTATLTHTATPIFTFTSTATNTPTVTDTRTSTATVTDTPTRTATATATFTRTSTSTPLTCPGSGTVSINNAGTGGFSTNFTFAVRIDLPGSVNLTSIVVRNVGVNGNEKVGIYSDNGSGTAPANLLTSATYLNGACCSNQTVDIPDIAVSPGYKWLALSGTVGGNFDNFANDSSVGPAVAFPGQMPSTASNFGGGFAPSLGVNWSCP